MFSFWRTLEILLFALCNFAPYVVLSFLFFRKFQRFSTWITGLACTGLFLIQFATRYWSAMHGISTSIHMSIFRLLIFIGGYILLFEQHWGKILYVELIFANLGNFILIAAVCLERNLFPNINHDLYCWHSSIIMVLLHLALTLPWSLEAKKQLLPMLDNRLVKKEWNYYWIVPFVFYIIWQYQINGGTETGLENIQNPYNVVFLFIINIGSLLIYYLMLMLDGQLAKNLELEEQRRYQDVEKIEFRALQERMEETRRMRHDLRHHIHMVNYYLEEKEYDKLQEYVNVYQDSIPDGDRIRFCENRIINNILFYFASQAKEQQIDFSVQLAIPDDLQVKDHEISVLLGNLLENAVQACAQQAVEKRRIIIRGKGDEHSLLFTIDNTFGNELKTNENGEFLTTKPHGSGVGIGSVKKIVERYDGFFSASQKGEMFCVSFVLNI